MRSTLRKDISTYAYVREGRHQVRNLAIVVSYGDSRDEARYLPQDPIEEVYREAVRCQGQADQRQEITIDARRHAVGASKHRLEAMQRRMYRETHQSRSSRHRARPDLLLVEKKPCAGINGPIFGAACK